MARLRIALKRVYEAPSDDDGLRILVERLWPRCVSKADAKIDHWLKDVSPSPALRSWYGHQVEKWQEFKRRYRGELKENSVVVDELIELCAGKKVCFVFATKDSEHSSAILLRDFLLEKVKWRNAQSRLGTFMKLYSR